MDQSSDRRRLRGIRDFREPSGVPLPVAPGRTSVQHAMTVLCKERRWSVDLRVVLAIPRGIEGHEVSGMKFHAPRFAILLGLDRQKSESGAKPVYPERADFDVTKCDGAKLPKTSLDGVVDYAG